MGISQFIMSNHRRRRPCRSNQRTLRFEALETRRVLTLDVDLQSLFNVDGVRTGDDIGLDPAEDTLDGIYQLATATAIEELDFEVVGFSRDGIPDDGRFGRVTLGYRNDDDGNNTLQLLSNPSGPASVADIDVVDGQYTEVLLAANSTNDTSGITVRLHYADGSSTNLTTTLPDWLNSSFLPIDSGDAHLENLVTGFDRVEVATDKIEDVDLASIQLATFPVDSGKTLQRLEVELTNPAIDGTRLNIFGVTLNGDFDYGDAPFSGQTLLADNGARHFLGRPGPTLGSVQVDAETLEDNAFSDDLDGTDDEDGVSFVNDGKLFVDTRAEVAVTLGNVSADGNLLDAWIDFDGDAILEPHEQVFDSLDLGSTSGTQILEFEVPFDAVNGVTHARFRISSTGGLEPHGAAIDGEVEDHLVTIQSDVPQFLHLVGVDFGASNGTSPNRWTTISEIPTPSAEGVTTSNLISEDGFRSPYALQLVSNSTQTIQSFLFGDEIPNLPQHSQSLSGVDGGLSTSSADQFHSDSGLVGASPQRDV